MFPLIRQLISYDSNHVQLEIRSTLEIRLLIHCELVKDHPDLFIQAADSWGTLSKNDYNTTNMNHKKMSWPTLGHKKLDLVQLLREVILHGGYDHVIATKSWMTCGHVLYLPQSCTAISHGLKSNYEKYLLKLEKRLLSELTTYQKEKKNYNEPVCAHVNEKDDLIETRAKKRSRTKTNELNVSLLFEKLDEQEVGGLAAGYNPRALLPEELLAFEQFSYRCNPMNRSFYLDIRNHILLKWCQKPRYELLLGKDIIFPLQTRFENEVSCEKLLNYDLIAHVFYFLETTGSINCGIFQGASIEERGLSWIPGRNHSAEGRRHFCVIGAGFAGLAAAKQLCQFGHKVTVLEARRRVGGRVFSDHSFGDDIPVDLGAMLITGGIAHPCKLLCHQLSLPLHEVNPLCPLLWSDGRSNPLVTKAEDEMIEKIFSSASEKSVSHKINLLESEIDSRVNIDANDIAKNTDDCVYSNRIQYDGTEKERALIAQYDIPLSVALDTHIRTKLIHKENISDNINKDHEALINWHLANLEYACATSLCNVSNTHFDQDDEYSFQGPHYLVPDGFQTITNKLAENIGIENIHFNSVVNHINTTGEYVIVNYKDPSKKTLRCDAVIITVPLGVLKHQSIKFSPPMPSWKEQTISRLGFGNLNKVAVEFPFVFWNENCDVMGRVVSSKDDKTCFLDLGDKNNEPWSYEVRRGEFFTFWALNRYLHNKKPILLFLVAGAAANNIENMKDNLVIECLMKTIRLCHPSVNVPDPINVVVTKWASDPFSRGSYSYVSLGATGQDYSLLAETIDDRVYFAGEATSRLHPATTGGAYLSGLREACKVVCAYGRYVRIPKNIYIKKYIDMFSLTSAWYGFREQKGLLNTDQFLHDVWVRRSNIHDSSFNNKNNQHSNEIKNSKEHSYNQKTKINILSQIPFPTLEQRDLYKMIENNKKKDRTLKGPPSIAKCPLMPTLLSNFEISDFSEQFKVLSNFQENIQENFKCINIIQ